MKPDNRSKDASQTLARGLRVLDLIAQAKQPLAIREVVEAIQLPRSIVQRLISTLEAEGLVMRDDRDGGYRLSLKMWSMGCAAIRGLDVREAARPVMRELAAKSGETVKLGAIDGAFVVTLESVVSQQTVRAYIPLGGRASAQKSATGKAILAFMSPQQLVQNGFGEGGESVITPALAEELEAVRSCGYAVNHGEMSADTAAIAAPIFNAREEVVGCVGIILPVSRFTQKKLDKMKAWVVEAAGEISVGIGYQSQQIQRILERS